MTKNPLKISFPVVMQNNNRVILLQMAPINPANGIIGSVPTHCKVIGVSEIGQMLQFIIPIKEWQEAVRNPCYFMEVENIVAPQGGIVDKNGSTLVGKD